MSPISKTISVRTEQPNDEAFLFELYASTRQEELNAWGWPLEARNAFLTMQFRASQAQYHAYAGAEFQIVMLDSLDIGRMILHDADGEIRLVDIALLPQHRNAGVGTALLQKIMDEAAATNRPVRLSVLKDNRAQRLYQRLGFVKTGENELHWQMEWRISASWRRPHGFE